MTTPQNTFVPLELTSGFDWGIVLTIVPAIALVAPVMEIRRDRSASSQLLARLDTTGTADGRIDDLGNNRYGFYLTRAFTQTLEPGRGFWQVAALSGSRLIPVASGAFEIKPHVVDYAGTR